MSKSDPSNTRDPLYRSAGQIHGSVGATLTVCRQVSEHTQKQPPLPGSDNHEIPAAERAIAQIDLAVSKQSLTTVDSMFALVAHTGVSRDAGSVVDGMGCPTPGDAGGIP